MNELIGTLTICLGVTLCGCALRAAYIDETLRQARYAAQVERRLSEVMAKWMRQGGGWPSRAAE